MFETLNFCHSYTGGFISRWGSIDRHYRHWVDPKLMCVFSGLCYRGYICRGHRRGRLRKSGRNQAVSFPSFALIDRKNNPRIIPQLTLQRSLHPGRVRTRVSGLHQVYEAENRPRGPTDLGRLLTAQIHPAMAALHVLLIKTWIPVSWGRVNVHSWQLWNLFIRCKYACLFGQTDYLGGNTQAHVNWDFYCFEQ